MSQNLPNWYFTEYARNIDLLLQQKDSRFSSLVTVGMHSGDKASVVDQLGTIEMQDVVGRFNPMGRVDAPTERRWVFPVSSDLPQLIDAFDKLKLLTDPQSSYVTNAVAAGQRRKDKHIISAFFADALIGQNAGTTEQFGTTLTSAGGQNVSVGVGGAASGMNVAKLRETARRFMAANVDIEAEGGINVGLTSKQHDDLLGELQVINADYGTTVFNGKKLLTSWWVFNFVNTELLGTGTDDAAGTSTACPAWVKSGMHLGMWESLVTDISQRKDLSGLPWQVYTKMTAGATRLEKAKVVRIWCR